MLGTPIILRERYLASFALARVGCNGIFPEARLPAFLKLLRAQSDAERHLGLEAAEASLDSRNMGFRIVGPEYQGLKKEQKIMDARNIW